VNQVARTGKTTGLAAKAAAFGGRVSTRNQHLAAGTALALAVAFASAPASATVTLVTTQAAFSGLGAITQNTNWDTSQYHPDDYFPGWSHPGNPFTVGDLTFVSGLMDNVIGGTGPYGYNSARSLLTDQNYFPTTIQIAGSHDLFAFNLGEFRAGGAVNIVVVTNLGSYSFTPIVSSAMDFGPLTFVGFQADAGEVFDSVSYQHDYPSAVGATDIQLGTAAIPEPAAWALMLTGFLGAGAALRRARRRQAALAA
jgi:hypothetical protein